MMKLYKREDGTTCGAEQFKGVEANSSAVLKLIGLLNENDVRAVWVDAVHTDTYEETDEGEIVEIILPEHIKICGEESVDDDGETVELGGDEAKIGDWIVHRDGGFYVMDGQLFEAIYEEVQFQVLTASRVTNCMHCGREITNRGDDGVVYKGFKHTEGVQRGLVRCWPADTGKPYGLDATPEIEEN